jgi:alkane 1-monooxygenase
MQLIQRLEQRLPRSKLDVFGRDSLLKTSIPYYILTLLPALGLFVERPNPYIFIAISYAAFPLLDELFSFDSRNPTSSERNELEKDDPYFRMTLYTAVILSWATFLKSMRLFAEIEISIDTLPFLLGYVFIVSNYYAAQFAVSHELMHKPGRLYRFLATAHMVKLYYPHFTYHHLNRHHFQVATPSDPSTARKGETVYAFIVRCIVYSWKGVYED